MSSSFVSFEKNHTVSILVSDVCAPEHSIPPEYGISETDGLVCADELVKNVRTPLLVVANDELFPWVVALAESN